MDSLDAKHKTLMSHQLFKFGVNDTIKPVDVEAAGLLQLDQCICGLFTNGEHRVNHHTDHCLFHLLSKHFLVNIL